MQSLLQEGRAGFLSLLFPKRAQVRNYETTAVIRIPEPDQLSHTHCRALPHTHTLHQGAAGTDATYILLFHTRHTLSWQICGWIYLPKKACSGVLTVAKKRVQLCIFMLLRISQE